MSENIKNTFSSQTFCMLEISLLCIILWSMALDKEHSVSGNAVDSFLFYGPGFEFCTKYFSFPYLIIIFHGAICIA